MTAGTPRSTSGHSTPHHCPSHSSIPPPPLPAATDVLILGATAPNLSAALDIIYHNPSLRVTVTDSNKPEVFDEDDTDINIKQPLDNPDFELLPAGFIPPVSPRSSRALSNSGGGIDLAQFRRRSLHSHSHSPPGSSSSSIPSSPIISPTALAIPLTITPPRFRTPSPPLNTPITPSVPPTSPSPLSPSRHNSSHHHHGRTPSMHRGRSSSLHIRTLLRHEMEHVQVTVFRPFKLHSISLSNTDSASQSETEAEESLKKAERKKKIIVEFEHGKTITTQYLLVLEDKLSEVLASYGSTEPTSDDEFSEKEELYQTTTSVLHNTFTLLRATPFPPIPILTAETTPTKETASQGSDLSRIVEGRNDSAKSAQAPVSGNGQQHPNSSGHDTSSEGHHGSCIGQILHFLSAPAPADSN